MLNPLLRGRRRHRMHAKAARIKRPSEPAHDPALARSVPSFQRNHRALWTSEVGLLHLLQNALQLHETPLVRRTFNLRVTLQGSEPETFGDQKILGFHRTRLFANDSPPPYYSATVVQSAERAGTHASGAPLFIRRY